MKMKNKFKTDRLISMVEYVNMIGKSTGNDFSDASAFTYLFSYAKHLKTVPTLGQFIPCDLEGNVLTNPKEGYDFDSHNLDSATKQYQQAESRVLFEGWEMVGEDDDFVLLRLKSNSIDEIQFFKNGGNIYYDDISLSKKITTTEDLVNYNLKFN